MFAQRTISWNAALRNLHGDRTRPAPGIVQAQAMGRTFLKTRGLRLLKAGTYDRSSIMKLAALVAKAIQERTGDSWGEAMSVALKAVWHLAKVARIAAVH